MQLFLSGADEGLRDLRRSEAAQDASGALRAAHKLKGSARNVGAEALASLAERLEERGRGGAIEGMRPLLDEADAHLGRLREALSELTGDQ
jgi:HPt (histidine-containing phosphotransfer) domain-containing protein